MQTQQPNRFLLAERAKATDNHWQQLVRTGCLQPVGDAVLVVGLTPIDDARAVSVRTLRISVHHCSL